MKFATPSKAEPKGRAPRRKYVPCEVATDVRDRIIDEIKDAIVNHPRSQQVEMGPSEVADSCSFCLGAKLMEFPLNDEVAWLPFIGTAVHEKLESIFSKKHELYVAEQRVYVGRILEQALEGNADLYDLTDDTVVDFKIVGATTLKEARLGGPSKKYRGQAHCYGRGFSLRGFDVKYVAIFYLPRNSRSLDDAVWWAEEYNEDVAIDALKRVESIGRDLEIFGWDYWRHHLPKDPDCFTCERWDFGNYEKEQAA